MKAYTAGYLLRWLLINSIISLALAQTTRKPIAIKDGLSFDEFVGKNEKAFILVQPEGPYGEYARKEFIKSVEYLGYRHSDFSYGIINLNSKDPNVLTIKYIKEVSTLDLQAVNVLVFRNGKRVQYTGGISSNLMIPWIEKYLAPIVEEILTVTEWESIIFRKKPLVIGYFVSKEEGAIHGSEENEDLRKKSQEDLEKFMYLAKNLHSEVYFAKTNSAEVLNHVAKTDRHLKEFSTKYRPSTKTHIAIYREFDWPLSLPEEKFASETASSSDQKEIVELNRVPVLYLSTWILENAQNYVSYVSESTFNELVSDGLPIVLTWLDLQAPEDHILDWLRMLRRVATKFRGTLNFAYASANTDLNMHQRKLFGIEHHKLPALSILDFHKERQSKFVFDVETEVTKKKVGEWCYQFLKGQLSPTVKSAPEPAIRSIENPIQEITYNTFEQVVNNRKVNVIVAFYSESDLLEHDRYDKFIFDWSNVAEKMWRKNTIIARYNLDENDRPKNHHFLETNPAVRGFFAGKPDHVDFLPTLTLTPENISAFVKANDIAKISKDEL